MAAMIRACLILALVVFSYAEDPLVTSESGTVRGRTVHTRNSNRDVFSFMGVPYAAPPLGEFRFQPPQPLQTWEGVRDARDIGPMCSHGTPLYNQFLLKCQQVTFPMREMSEDCLNLDVYTPSLRGKRPVLFWIHGGGYFSGTSSYHNGTAYAALEDIVLVTTNYRLGMLGFLTTGDDTVPGNMGLQDIVAALQWVQKNIGQFGGDPAQVTIMGQSAGGLAVSTLAVIPEAKGLFQRIIALSGGPVGRTHPSSTQTYHLTGVAELLGCPTDMYEAVECFRKKTVDELVKAEADYRNTGVMWPFFSVIDGTFIPKYPLELYQEGASSGIDIMGGVASHEWYILSMMALPHIMKQDSGATYSNVMATIQLMLGSLYKEGSVKDTLPKIENLYLRGDEANLTPDDLRRAMVEILGDFDLVGGTYYLMELADKYGKGNNYLFELRRPAFEITPKRHDWVHSDHTDDTVFAFGDAFMEGVFADREFTEEEKQLSRIMMKYQTNFIKYGEPNGAEVPVEWPRYTTESGGYLELGHEPKQATNFKAEAMKLFSEMMKNEFKRIKDEL